MEKDLDAINQAAAQLSAEAADVLEYQAASLESETWFSAGSH